MSARKEARMAEDVYRRTQRIVARHADSVSYRQRKREEAETARVQQAIARAIASHRRPSFAQRLRNGLRVLFG